MNRQKSFLRFVSRKGSFNSQSNKLQWLECFLLLQYSLACRQFSRAVLSLLPLLVKRRGGGAEFPPPPFRHHWPYAVVALHCLFLLLNVSRKAVNTTFWFDPTGNRTIVFRLRSRRSIHSTTDRLNEMKNELCCQDRCCIENVLNCYFNAAASLGERPALGVTILGLHHIIMWLHRFVVNTLLFSLCFVVPILIWTKNPLIFRRRLFFFFFLVFTYLFCSEDLSFDLYLFLVRKKVPPRNAAQGATIFSNASVSMIVSSQRT